MTAQELRDKINGEKYYTALSFDYALSLFGSLYLIEVNVSNAAAIETFVDEITQDTEDGQAPYQESYFDESGTRKIDMPDENSNFPCRLCFYLHFVDLKVPLEIAGQFIPLPIPRAMPKRLAQVLEYRLPN